MKEETSCHCSPPVAAFLHPTFPGSQYAGKAISCQPTALANHTVATQEQANTAEIPPVPRTVRMLKKGRKNEKKREKKSKVC